MMDSTAEQLLKRSAIEVAPGIYTLLSLDEDRWNKVLSNPKLSPSMASPFMILKDRWEVTLLLDERDFARIRDEVAGAPSRGNLRLVTFDVVLDFGVVGFLAAVSELLASAGIPMLTLSAFGRDHLLIDQTHLAAALNVLGPKVDSLC